MTVILQTVLPMLILVGWPGLYAQTSGAAPAGTVEKIKVHGASLEGNLEGDPAERDVFVYLPPSYATRFGSGYWQA